MDPITVIATASAAYNAVKKGIAVGRELQDMTGQLATWAGAVSDLEFLAKRAANPQWYKSFGSNVQAEAIEIFAAKKKIQAQRDELRTFLQYSYGHGAWEELLRIEAQVRKQKAATDHRKAEIKETIITTILVILVMAGGIAALALLAFILWSAQQK